MSVLVTGGSGFVGSHVVEVLLSKEHDVVCPVRNPLSSRHLEKMPVRIASLDRLEALLDEVRPEYVFHIAGATRALDYEGYRRANVELTGRLLDLLSRSEAMSTLKRFVLVSSQAASGPSIHGSSFRTEEDPPSPVSLYGRSKLEAEKLVLQRSGEIPVTIVRPPTVFGPRDVDVLGVFKCARFRVAPCIAGPDRFVSIIYVKDLADGILAAAFSPNAVGETYFLANPKPVIWRQFAVRVAKLMGYRATALPVPVSIMRMAAWCGDLKGRISDTPPLLRSEKLLDITQVAWVCSSEKAYRQLGWRPKVPLDEAIRKTAAWYRTHGWIR